MIGHLPNDVMLDRELRIERTEALNDFDPMDGIRIDQENCEHKNIAEHQDD